jgi:ribosomal protein S18 acetylase RimI-like enzyme
VLTFVTADEARFNAVAAGSPYSAQLEEYLASILTQRATRPEWCVVALDGERPIARGALWAPAGQPVPTDFVLLDADWDEPRLAGAHRLLTRLHEQARELGGEALSHHVDDPPAAPQYQEHAEARVQLLEDAGYTLLRDGLRWRYSGSPPERPDPSLTFRTLAEVGDDAFVAAIATTYEGTRDSLLTRALEEHGAPGAARADFTDAQALEYEPEWWELSYVDDALAGVIMGARNPSSAVVWYVGVVPDARGRGLATQLVRRGTERLLAAGLDEIRGDCDLANVGMIKGFERAGYELFARRRSYQLQLG